MAPQRNTKHRCWSLTLNDFDEEFKGNEENFFLVMDPAPKWYYCQYERGGENDVRHLQGAVYFHQPVFFLALKEMLPGWHLEPARNAKHLWDYCHKAESRCDDFPAFGKGEGPSQGKRNDLAAAFHAQLAGQSSQMLLFEQPALFRYERSIRSMANLIRQHRLPIPWEDKKVIVIWGKAGIGKSRYVRDHCGADLYVTPFNRETEWMDGYDGERNVLVDDFDGHRSSKWWKEFSDKYPRKNAQKGGFTFVDWQTLWITSNFPPTQWTFDRNEACNDAAILRRLDHVFECNSVEELSQIDLLFD